MINLSDRVSPITTLSRLYSKGNQASEDRRRCVQGAKLVGPWRGTEPRLSADEARDC